MIQILLLSISIIPSLSSVPTQKINSFENRNVSTILIRFAFRFSLFPSCPSSPFQLVSIWLEPDTLVLFSSSFLPSWVRVTVSIERRCRYVHALRARFLIVRKKEGTGEIPSISLESKIIARKHEIEKRVYDQLDVIRWRTWRTDEWRM